MGDQNNISIDQNKASSVPSPPPTMPGKSPKSLNYKKLLIPVLAVFLLVLIIITWSILSNKEKPEETILTKMFKSWVDINFLQYNFQLKFENQIPAELREVEGMKALLGDNETIWSTIEMTGYIQMTEDKFDYISKFSTNSSSPNYPSANREIRKINNFLYFKMDDYASIFGLSYKDIIGDSWVKGDIENPTEKIKTETLQYYDQLKAYKKFFTKKTEAVNILVQNNPIIIDQFLTDEKIDGQDCYHLAIKLDLPKLTSLLNNNKNLFAFVDTSQLEQSSAWKNLDLNGNWEIWIDKDESLLKKISYQKSRTSEKDGADGQDTAILIFSEFNKPFTIDVPSDIVMLEKIYQLNEEQARAGARAAAEQLEKMEKDSDGDGYNDYEEEQTGHDPFDPNN